MNWTRPSDLRDQLLKLWDRGDLLARLVTGESLFPRRLALKDPTSAEMTDHFDEVRDWSRDLRAATGYRIVMREFRHRVLGANAIPAEVWVDSLDQALALVGKQKEAVRFAALIELTRASQPLLLPWLARRPLRVLEVESQWSRFLEIVAWLQRHPRPGLYLRQVDIPGVHSKFMETHRGTLMELLDITLAPEAIDKTATGAGEFVRRYGFLGKPSRVRFRILDPELASRAACPAQDITVDAPGFARWDLGCSRVFVTENEINFLAFPAIKGSIVIFGSGYGFEMLSDVPWLARCAIHYWGDIDTHGFAILDQLRARFDHVESFLMDRATLMTFKMQWGDEATPTWRELLRLRPEEQALYDDLRDNRLGRHLRLEQERVGFDWVENALTALG
ncbi:DUF3322 domain-containing protein [Variovorax sp. Root434]|uniref:DUF3322 domain-containing protein n=1 Tax=Variovorax sp. Root434 TaxID=1736536 RepID=UPI0006F981D8|nr:Wadjet anti-phage system protein JetD domain-containing protein [Variovorax sp. Root434]KQX39469.1 hypothetical protein ASD05_02000 [Variovorax sp. Root434]